jgi:hypothetical protein
MPDPTCEIDIVGPIHHGAMKIGVSGATKILRSSFPREKPAADRCQRPLCGLKYRMGTRAATEQCCPIRCRGGTPNGSFRVCLIRRRVSALGPKAPKMIPTSCRSGRCNPKFRSCTQSRQMRLSASESQGSPAVIEEDGRRCAAEQQLRASPSEAHDLGHCTKAVIWRGYGPKDKSSPQR